MFGCVDWDLHRRHAARLVWLLALLVLLAGAAAIAAPRSAAAAKSVTWRSYDVTLALQEDGSYLVTERQAIDFSGGPFSGAFADLPLQRTDGIDQIAVSEVVNGRETAYRQVRSSAYQEAPNTFTTIPSSTAIEVDWGFSPAVSETRTFVLRYVVHGALRVYGTGADQYQQIWWTAISNDVTDIAPVEQATVAIELPRAVDLSTVNDADPNNDAVKLGEDADEKAADHTTDGKTWTWKRQSMSSGDEFTVRLEFPSMVDAPVPTWQAADDAQRLDAEQRDDRQALYNLIFLGIGLLTAALGAIGLYGLWYTRGRDPHVGMVADFLPAPPDDLPPGAAGALVDEVAHERDIVATLVDLGRRGIVAIDEQAGGGGVFGGGRDYEITLKQADPPVTVYEKRLLTSIFGGGLKESATERFSRAKQRFANNAGTIRADMYAELVKRGYFAVSPEQTRSRWRSGSNTALVVVVIAMIVGGGIIARVSSFAFFPLVVIAILLLVLGRLASALPRKTVSGAEAAAKWRAFRRYLSDIERYDKVAESKEIFDKYLPYAVAFGLEQSWVNKFASVGVEQPSWYGGGGPVILTGPGDWGMGPRRHGGGWGGGGWTTVSGGGVPNQPSGGGGGGGFDFPDLQGASDRAGRSVQGASNSFFDMLSSAAQAFSDFSGPSGGGGGGRRSWGGGGGGFHGGGGRGGSSGGGGRGFH